MPELPELIVKSGLYGRLSSDEELKAQLQSLRSVVEHLAQTTSRTLPNFTDHTIRHMDALWAVADRVLTPEEIARFAPAEAFLLGCGFYLHDIGMAYAATNEGLAKIKKTTVFRGLIAALPFNERDNPDIQSRAVAATIRQVHADAAKELAIGEIPGSAGRYLFEAQSFRDAWGTTCGEIASSHHWSISALEAAFEKLGEAPLPGGRKGDFLYVAACLRLIDFAHINRDRAPATERAFRFSIAEESLVHWLAQENIDGPERADNELVYRGAKPVSDVEAWWLYFGMLNGLDQEIRAVKRLLDQRKEGLKGITLQGVRGSATPEEAAEFIPTAGFLPIEVNLRTGSIDRLVELLAGETLYGPNPMAAIRELVQNARDAVMLKAETASGDAEKATLSIPIRVSLNSKSDPPTLEVLDHGIGMTRRVVTDYLIAIASDYWTSQFPFDFPDVAQRGFKNAGRFGIGFLSVFMLGTDVVVETNRVGQERYRLSLRGAGRRGELRTLPSPGGSGTAIRIKLKPSAIPGISPLNELVPIYAPALPHALLIEVDGSRTEFKAGWLKELPADDFHQWVRRASTAIRTRRSPHGTESFWAGEFSYRYEIRRRLRGAELDDSAMAWPVEPPQYIAGGTRLLASFESVSIICLRGLAVQAMTTPGFIGVIDLDSGALDVSRNRTVNANISEIIEEARRVVAPRVIENLNALRKDSLLIPKWAFIAQCARYYGAEVVTNSDALWISELSMPGNVTLIESSQAFSRATSVSSLFVAYNYGPWSAMGKWAANRAPSADKEAAFLLDDAEQRHPTYRSSTEGEKTGTLTEVWPEYPQSVLFNVLIGIIARAWQISPEDMANQGAWVTTESRLFGRLTRN